MKKGQSLIELLIAIGAISVILVSLVAVSTRSVANSAFGKIQIVANKKTEEQIERIRAYRDRNGLDSLNCSATCFIDASLVKSNGSVIAEGITVWYSLVNPGTCPGGNREATVFAQWSDSKGTHQSKLVSCFSRWK